MWYPDEFKGQKVEENINKMDQIEHFSAMKEAIRQMQIELMAVNQEIREGSIEMIRKSPRRPDLKKELYKKLATEE